MLAVQDISVQPLASATIPASLALASRLLGQINSSIKQQPKLNVSRANPSLDYWNH